MVVIGTFQRLRAQPDSTPLDSGVLTIEGLEIARLDSGSRYFCERFFRASC